MTVDRDAIWDAPWLVSWQICIEERGVAGLLGKADEESLSTDKCDTARCWYRKLSGELPQDEPRRVHAYEHCSHGASGRRWGVEVSCNSQRNYAEN